MIPNFLKPYGVLSIFLLAMTMSCNQPDTASAGKPAEAPSANDSAEQLTVLKSVYRWHDQNLTRLTDFPLIIKDSFQTGLNIDSFNVTFAALQQTGYFSSSFLANYKKIAEDVDKKLVSANPKLLNEINFPFQDSDPWTNFQDDFPNFWDSLKITGYQATADSASLAWKVQSGGWVSEGYNVRFAKENGKWKVAYLAGFDPATSTK